MTEAAAPEPETPPPAPKVISGAASLPKPGKELAISSLEVPAWGGIVYVRELAASESAVWQNVTKHAGKPVPQDDLINFLCAAICTPEGRPVFTTAEDKAALKRQSYMILLTIFTKAMETSYLTPTGVAAEKKG